MKSICAWCLKPLDGPSGISLDDSEISHGICKECLDNMEFQEGVSLMRYVESLSMPILVVDGDVCVLGANRAAVEFTGKAPDAILHRRGGDVFECKYARLPEGCGKTIHCSGCSIRRAVTECFTTGKPQIRIPAYLNPQGSHTLRLTITALKVKDSVLLRIDEIDKATCPQCA